MGREVRKVPPNYQHPRKCTHVECDNFECYEPQHDESYEEARKEWLNGLLEWLKEDHDCDYWEYHGPPPERKVYRNYKDNEATWYQVYETITEGTPVTPAFETEHELIDYLVEHGDFWRQRRAIENGLPIHGYSREAAETFVLRDKYCCSLTIVSKRLKENIDGCAE